MTGRPICEEENEPLQRRGVEVDTGGRPLSEQAFDPGGPSHEASRPSATAIFLAFASAYFLSALLRGVTATLAPVLSAELSLHAGDLGLLAGAYFLGFAALQLPLGRALDRFGAHRALMALLVLAILGCAAFAHAGSLGALIAARALIGMGVAACLMAPLTCFRHMFSFAAQLRANSWMLMTGSLGMLASTVPVQLLLPAWGWRGLFWGLAGLLLVALGLIALVVPRDALGEGGAGDKSGSYRSIVSHPLFLRTAPLGFFVYGGMIALQSLWAGPWLTQVTGATPDQAARGLFVINLSVLVTFMAWGALMPRLSRAGFDAWLLMRRGLPLSLVVLAIAVGRGQDSGAVTWALWCVSCTIVTLSQPAIGQAFPARLAGRALSAFNLLIFAGVFSLQWGIGLLIDALMLSGIARVAAFQVAFAAFGACCAVSYLWFLRPLRPVVDNRALERSPWPES